MRLDASTSEAGRDRIGQVHHFCPWSPSPAYLAYEAQPKSIPHSSMSPTGNPKHDQSGVKPSPGNFADGHGFQCPLKASSAQVLLRWSPFKPVRSKAPKDHNSQSVALGSFFLTAPWPLRSTHKPTERPSMRTAPQTRQRPNKVKRRRDPGYGTGSDWWNAPSQLPFLLVRGIP
ncbi:hypothetical protein CLAIMM_02603 [Cladophialophora immunda]|nr:hypothetical protein CLAIMM_02603 [Cladophialophora immunda]